MSEISLAVKSPSNGVLATSAPEGPSEYYPELHIDNYSGEFPKEGTMLVKFKKVRSSKDEKSGTTSCTLEIRSVSKVKGEKGDSATGFEKRGEALDKIKDEYEV